jgi:ABC-type proline/glycine betaine transport system permease subunit
VIPNEYYMAAFAAFLIHKETRICGSLCLLYMLVEWNAYELPNDEPDYLFQYYYLILAIYSLLACFLLKHSPNTKQNNLFMALFLIMATQDIWGFLLYTYNQEATVYNFLGNCIIIALILALWMTRNGKFEGAIYMPDILARIRSYI